MRTTSLVKRGVLVCLMALALAFAAGCGEKKDAGNPVVNGFIQEFDKLVTLLENKKPTEITQEEIQGALMKMAEGAKKIAAEKIQPTPEQQKKIQELTGRLQAIAQKFKAEQAQQAQQQLQQQAAQATPQVDTFIEEYEVVVTTLENKTPEEIKNNPQALQEAVMKMTQTASALKNQNIQPTPEQQKKIQDLTLRLQTLIQKAQQQAK